MKRCLVSVVIYKYRHDSWHNPPATLLFNLHKRPGHIQRLSLWCGRRGGRLTFRTLLPLFLLPGQIAPPEGSFGCDLLTVRPSYPPLRVLGVGPPSHSAVLTHLPPRLEPFGGGLESDRYPRGSDPPVAPSRSGLRQSTTESGTSDAIVSWCLPCRIFVVFTQRGSRPPTSGSSSATV